ncbi:hypothetical protein ACJMK2_016499 [Sinanodonta woodiana]|uniref:Uncharacterized protein n=1 Tax=Sinanodonta woodiana TaxID=1069815 RepID=A0ABD3UWJ3_SINWO
MLVYMLAMVDSEPSYTCQLDGETKGASKKSPDLRLKFTSDTISGTMSTKPYQCNANEPVNTLTCNECENSFPTFFSDADPERLNKWSDWTDCAMYNGTGIMYRYRDITSVSGQTKCCLSPCISLVDRQDSTIHTASSATGTEKNKELEKRYTLTEIILVALGCLLMGVILTALAFVLYMKRKQLGCFSKDIKDGRHDSKQQSATDMQYLTEGVAVKKYDPNNPKSKKENKAEEIQYQLLTSDQVGNDQQTYDELKVNEPRFDHKGDQPNSSRLQHTDNNYQIDQTPNFQCNNQGVYEYCRDNDIDGHSYCVLERENLSTKLRTTNMGRPETNAEGNS